MQSLKQVDAGNPFNMNNLDAKLPWPFALIFDTSDQMYKRFLEEVGPRKTSLDHANNSVKKWYKEDGIDEFTTHALHDGANMIDIFIPQQFASQRRRVMQEVLRDAAQHPAQEILQSAEAQARSYLNLIVNDFINIDGTSIIYVRRNKGNYDRREHPIANLEQIGMPQVITYEGEKMREANEALADLIQRGQLRFLNTRTISVPVEHEAMRQLGYTSLEFRKHDQQTEVIIITAGQRHSVHLNRFFQFDLGRQHIRNEDFKDSLHNVILQYMYRLLCTEPKTKDEAETTENGLQVTTRIGHMRRLQPNQTFSSYARNNYLEYEHGDLGTKVRTLQEEKETDLSYTYVKPIIDTNPNLPAIEYRIDQSDMPFVLQ